MDMFQAYLMQHAPDIAQKLTYTGKSNTGSTEGAMPKIWQEIASTDAKRFQDLQHSFALEYYYTPLAKNLLPHLPNNSAIEELLFSTAIQHGVKGASSIITQALEDTTLHGSTENFIRRVYSLRKKDFPSSSTYVQSAVKNRLTQEMDTILSLL